MSIRDIPAVVAKNGSVTGFLAVLASATIEIKRRDQRIPVAYFITVHEEFR
jgi:hypothetical protein